MSYIIAEANKRLAEWESQQQSQQKEKKEPASSQSPPPESQNFVLTVNDKSLPRPQPPSSLKIHNRQRRTTKLPPKAVRICSLSELCESMTESTATSHSSHRQQKRSSRFGDKYNRAGNGTTFTVHGRRVSVFRVEYNDDGSMQGISNNTDGSFTCVGHTYYAMDAICYHMGGSLEDGRLVLIDVEDMGQARGCGGGANDAVSRHTGSSHQRAVVVCPWHRYHITLDTGEGLYKAMDGRWKSKGIRQRTHTIYLAREEPPAPPHRTEKKYTDNSSSTAEAASSAAADGYSGGEGQGRAWGVYVVLQSGPFVAGDEYNNRIEITDPHSKLNTI